VKRISYIVVAKYEIRNTRHDLYKRYEVNTKEMREKTVEELDHLLATWREELFNLNVQAMTGQMEQYSRVRHIKKDIARVLTILKETPAESRTRAKESMAS
jgi:large subunit ribosomal protein L29